MRDGEASTTRAVVMRVNSDSSKPAWTFEVQRIRSSIKITGSPPYIDDVPQDIRDALLWWLQPGTEEAPNSATEPSEERKCGFVTTGPNGELRCKLPANHWCFHDYAPTNPAAEDVIAGFLTANFGLDEPDARHRACDLIAILAQDKQVIAPAEPAEATTNSTLHVPAPTEPAEEETNLAAVMQDSRRFEADEETRKTLGFHYPFEGAWSKPAPTEPAEEETKAETADAMQRRFIAEIRSMNPDMLMSKRLDDLEAELNASSPVVTAPTETGPWQRIEDVPKNVMVRGTDGTWRGDPDGWLRSPGARASANQCAPRSLRPRRDEHEHRRDLGGC